MPFQITEEDVERNDWDATDVGRWGYLINGAVMFCDTKQEADDGWRQVKKWERECPGPGYLSYD